MNGVGHKKNEPGKRRISCEPKPHSCNVKPNAVDNTLYIIPAAWLGCGGEPCGPEGRAGCCWGPRGSQVPGTGPGSFGSFLEVWAFACGTPAGCGGTGGTEATWPLGTSGVVTCCCPRVWAVRLPGLGRCGPTVMTKCDSYGLKVLAFWRADTLRSPIHDRGISNFL